MTSEYKPCPFCSSEVAVNCFTDGSYEVTCVKDCCSIPAKNKKELAAAVVKWNTRSVPEGVHTAHIPAPELVRYDPSLKYGNLGGMERNLGGEYVRYDQAAAMLAAKDERIADGEQERQQMAKDWFDFCDLIGVDIDSHEAVAAAVIAIKEQAEAAEAELAQIKAQVPVAYLIEKDGFGKELSLYSVSKTYTENGYKQSPLYAAPVDQTAEIERLREALNAAYASMDAECSAHHKIAMGTVDRALSGKSPA